MFDIMESKKLRATVLSRILGISASSVSNWKVRGTDPPAEYLLLICEFLGVTVHELLGGCDTADQNPAEASPRELARTAFFDGLTEEHISLIHCYCALTADEQAEVWNTITRMRALKKGSFSDSPNGKNAEPTDSATA